MNKATLALLACCVVAAVLTVTPTMVFADEVSTGATANTQPTSSPTPTVMADANYRIQEEDILKLDVWGEQQLSNLQLQVTPDGKINVAYLGEMQAAGLTQSELTANIVKKFEDDQILINPKVQLTILSLHQPTVRVLGAVTHMGEVTFKDGDTILDAVGRAGYSGDAWLEKATITHKGSDKPVPIDLRKMLNGDLSQNAKLQKGDIINIPPMEYQNQFYVMGQVMRPMMYSLRDRTTVMTALNMAGGPTERASLKSTVVIRGGPDKPEKVKCNLGRLFDKADLSQDIALQPGDVVYVPETNKPNWNKISAVLSAITSLSYIRRLGLF
ncbi:MAG: polysaccharide biosynthesis/export family protein [Armatimonadetes bacterium]|nr:polysaccharide biosynthesis/export family protein [Armatimonadota bacterium]